MSAQLHERAKQIAAAAMPLDADRRAALLDQLAADWPELRSRVEQLLAAQETLDGEELLSEGITEALGPNQDQFATVAEARDGTKPEEPPGHSPPTSADQRSPLSGVGKVFGDDYELIQVIGRGGMGTVYKAYQRSLRRHVALKTISRDKLRSPADVARFQVEAEAAARLDHPGIVPVYDIGQRGGHHYYSMAYVEGQSLSQLLKRNRKGIRPRAAAVWMEKVCRAVQFAHERAVIHRDLKPSNILLDEDGNPRLTDFGLAKLQTGDDGLTITGQVLGTPSYMAPEQAAGNHAEVSNRTDVYSLGATLYALLCGRPPFSGGTVVETLRQVVDSEPPSLGSTAAGVPRDLQTICAKCMAKRPVDRYVSAGEMAEDLERYLQGFPIAARPLGTWARGLRWCRRNPLVATLLGVTIVALIAGTIVSLAFGIEARRQEAAAQEALTTAELYALQLEEAIEEFFVVVSEDKLLNQSGMQRVREELLQKARNHYAKLASEVPENERTRLRLAKAQNMLGKVEAADGQAEAAETSFRNAESNLQRIIRQSPANVEALMTLANTHNELARLAYGRFARSTKLQQIGELPASEAEEAESYLADWLRYSQQAVDQRTRIVELRPHRCEPLRLLANAYMNHGVAMAGQAEATGQLAKAESARARLNGAQEIRRKALERFPEHRELIRDMGNGYDSLGKFESRLAEHEADGERQAQHYERAVAEFTSAIDAYENFLESSSELDARFRLVNCYRVRADVQFQRNRLAAAEQDYVRAVTLARNLSESNPRVYTYRVQLADIQFNLCQLLFVRSEAIEAISVLDDCQRTLIAAIRIDPTVSHASAEFTRFVASITRNLAAIEQYDEAVKRLDLAIGQLQALVDESAEYLPLQQYVDELAKVRHEIEQQVAEQSERA